jgi:4-amino-4-deoxy-L-arabinose transferase-like glycosyltransferase
MMYAVAVLQIHLRFSRALTRPGRLQQRAVGLGHKILLFFQRTTYAEDRRRNTTARGTAARFLRATISVINDLVQPQSLTTETSAPVEAGYARPRAEELARERRMLLVMVLVALALRLAVLTIGATYEFPAREDHFSFGWETGRIARSIATGEGFSSPFHGHTGPTAWIAPLYPYFLALLFKFFGVYSNAAAWLSLAFNSIFSALTCITIFCIGKEIFGLKVAKWAAWIWAVLPYSIYWAVRFAWETSLATFLLSVVFLLAVRIEHDGRVRDWIWFGLLWGIIALANPSLLAFLPFAGAWILYRQWRNASLRFAPVLLSTAVFVLVMTPWLMRNYRTFGQAVFIRGNFGAELRMGNGPNADGTWMFWLHPTQNKLQLERYRELGEPDYVKERQRQALQWIANNPGRFAQISLKRAFFFWFGTPRAARSAVEAQTKDWFFSLSSILALLGLGVALKRCPCVAWLFFWLILSVPMMYYFTFSHPRYRHPIEPELLLLMIYVISEAKHGGNVAVAHAGTTSGARITQA